MRSACNAVHRDVGSAAVLFCREAPALSITLPEQSTFVACPLVAQGQCLNKSLTVMNMVHVAQSSIPSATNENKTRQAACLASSLLPAASAAGVAA